MQTPNRRPRLRRRSSQRWAGMEWSCSSLLLLRSPHQLARRRSCRRLPLRRRRASAKSNLFACQVSRLPESPAGWLAGCLTGDRRLAGFATQREERREKKMAGCSSTFGSNLNFNGGRRVAAAVVVLRPVANFSGLMFVVVVVRLLASQRRVAASDEWQLI